MVKKILIIALMVLTLSTVTHADSVSEVVSLGKDITSTQEDKMLKEFGVDSDVEIVRVSNEEEHKYLGDYVSKSLIGSKAISCSYVKLDKKGSGLEVKTSNVSWVSDDMVKGALGTAGIEDAKVEVSAPFKVSGTAALTGIIKAFEGASGDYISEEQKQVANEEIAKTGELGQDIGLKKATELVNEVKIKVVEENITDPKEIRVVIEEKAKDLNIKLDEEQFNKIVSLMENISGLDINSDKLKGQLGNLAEKAKEFVKGQEAKGLFSKIKSFFSDFLDKIKN